jgi:hypothetical protein
MINLHFEAKTWAEILAQISEMIKVRVNVTGTVPTGAVVTPLVEPVEFVPADPQPEPTVIPPAIIPTETPVAPPGVPIQPTEGVIVPPVVAGAPPAAELDSAGLPWSDQIHARTKTKTADGKWKLKRGADPKLIAQVQAAAPPVGQPVTGLPGVADVSPVPNTVETFMAYAAKIDAAGAGSYVEIQAHLADQGIANIIQVPEEKIGEVANGLKEKFGVAF